MHKECFPKEGWKVLEKIKDIAVKNSAVLGGGTALALHIGHRMSVDLDFFTGKPFRVETLISDIRKLSSSFNVIAEGEDFLTANVDGIKVSLFKYDYPFTDRLTSCKGIKVAGPLDIAAMKIIAVSQRGTKRDFVDLYFLLQDIPFHRIAAHTVKRFGPERINPVHIGKSFVYFSDADSDPEPQYLKGKEVKWDKIRKFFRSHVKQIVFDLDAAVKEQE